MSSVCFMAQPLDGGKFDKWFDDVFAPAVAAAGLEAYRVDRDAGASVPIESIERGIRDAAAVFVDVTADNPNVWFELGYAIAAGKDLCLVCSTERTGPFPFDVQHRKIIRYAPDAPRDFEGLKVAITERLTAILAHQVKRADIQAIVAEPHNAGLTEFEAAALACIASEASGVETTVSNWLLRNEMEKAGFNKLACNVAVRNLRGRSMLQVIMEDGQDGPYEAYSVTEEGWNWITQNTHSLNLTTPAQRAKGGFDKAMDKEIPL
ncbi:MAG: hypothetical protein NW217_03760 [Hyphomicrobiaceae bacterium]|nr:hypothetical protein [Hyphomicrobiaceae bacterium]